MSRLAIFYTIAGIMVFLYLTVLVLFFFPFSSKKSSVEQLPQLTSSPVRDTQTSTIQSNGTQKLLKILEDRPVLPAVDKDKRALLIAPLNNDSGIIYQTPDYILSYLKTPDVFQVEITTLEIEKAKEESAAWLLTQGLSQSALCNLPLMYFPSYTVLESLKTQGKTYSPLPGGC